MADTFVSREAELDTLGSFLHLSLSKSTQVCFVIGEAGTGKTRLIEEFVRRSETLSDDLLFVKGNCNAQSGISDPYLPFRSILGMLSGDHTNAITRNNAQRLSSVLKTSGRALVEVAPELVGTLIPGASILISLARLGAKEKGWLKALEERAQDSERNANDIKQSEIFFQYTAFLRDLAKTNPLVIILDDLQWVDAASNALFFHLARELKDTPILLIGTYRPNDVTMGRDGNRHPLEQTLNEVKRIYGDIGIDLDASMHQNGRAFVESLVNSEPNSLNSRFIDALFAKTGGHALFTAELLSSMQERGDLIQDANGLWQESSQLDWNNLPARVEAIVAERIERLEDDLREMLDIACIEGQDFTAQIIARIQDLKDREVIRKLSRELDRCHRLVQDTGEIPVGDTFLSRYTFNHALFQAYLYSELSATERRLFHAQVAHTLESIYSENVDGIAVQLARHYLESGNFEKSAIYLEKAGESAYKLGELLQALSLFSQALSNIEIHGDSQKLEQKARLLVQIGKTYYYTGHFDDAERTYRHSIQLFQELNDDEKISDALSRLAQALRHQRRTDEALECAQEALSIARRVGNRKLESKALWTKGTVYRATDRIEERLSCYKEALDIAIETEDIIRKMSCLCSLGVLNEAVLGNQDKAVEYYSSALEIAIQQQKISAQSTYMSNLSGVHRKLGNYVKAEEFRGKALELRERLGNISATSLSYAMQGTIHLRLGHIDASIESYKKSVEIADRCKRFAVQVNSRSKLLLIYLMQDDLETALNFNDQIKPLLNKYRNKSSVFNQIVLDAILALRLGQLEKANACFTQALQEATEALSNQRWSNHYHRAFAQAGLTLLNQADEFLSCCEQALTYFRNAVDACGWVGILDDALMIIRELQKMDPDNRLKPIETYLLEKREIAWKNRPYSD